MSAVRFGNVGDNFSHHQAAGDGSEGTAVDTAVIRAYDKDRAALRFEPLDHLDHLAVIGVAENNHIAWVNT